MAGTLDHSSLSEMERMAAEAPSSADGSGVATPLDLGGERGEYHTMCLDGPLYARPVNLLQPKEVQALELTAQVGQKEGERWWAISMDAIV